MKRRNFIKSLSFLPFIPMAAKAGDEGQLLNQIKNQLKDFEQERAEQRLEAETLSSLTKVEQIAREEACEAFESQNWFGTPKA